MAQNTINNFRNADKVSAFRYVVTNSDADVFASDASNLRDLTRLVCVNTSGSAVNITLRLSDGTNHEIIHVVSIPANSGQAAGALAIRLLQDTTYQLPVVRLDPFGNYYVRIPKGYKLRASAATTSVLILLGVLETFEV